MYTRRRALLIGAVGLTALSGCTELATGDEPLSREASPVAISESVLSETGHELQKERTETLTEEVEAGGESREVEATNHITLYANTVEGLDGEDIESSLFGVVSTPAFEFVGRSFNPIADADNEEILEFASSEFGELEIGEKLEETTLTVLDSETTVSTFDGTARFDGQRIDIRVYVTAVDHKDDIVLGVGGYPEDLEDDQADDILELFEGIEHPVD